MRDPVSAVSSRAAVGGADRPASHTTLKTLTDGPLSIAGYRIGFPELLVILRRVMFGRPF